MTQKTPPRIERFGEIKEVINLPELTEVQVNSFKAFLQADRAPDQRDNVGLESAFREVFPIDETEKGRSTGLVLDYLEYRLGDPPYSPEECREKDLTYQAPMYAKLQLIHKDSGLIKEDQVFLGDLPLPWPIILLRLVGAALLEGRRRGVRHVVVSMTADPENTPYCEVCGIATDHCVRATVLDALREGFAVRLLTDTIAGVAPETTQAALAEMAAAGATTDA